MLVAQGVGGAESPCHSRVWRNIGFGAKRQMAAQSVSRLFENVPMWTRLKCPHSGVVAVAAMPVDGDFVNEREGTEAFGVDGRGEERVHECSGGWAGDGSVLSTGQADLAALSPERGSGTGASAARPTWTSPQEGRVSRPSPGAFWRTLCGFWPHLCRGEIGRGRSGHQSRDVASLAGGGGALDGRPQAPQASCLA